ncbi:hypothetical protein CIG19_18650 [Enterobacterales bacterium CwR94]|nr:hypothetical protein CIG19_18650 [Enterobacterales bacterium CwR94]
MSLPKISVIVPCFNHERYIDKCLESIRGSYQGIIEVIICDDKSIDNSLQKIQDYLSKFTDNSISYVLLTHDVNQGITKTLNECVSHATADYIYLIASDDYLVKDGLTLAMNCLLDSSADAVISDCLVVNSDDSILHQSAFFEYRHASLTNLQKKIAKELVFNWVVPGPALLQKKSVFISLNGFNKDLMAEDRDYYLRLLASKKVVFNEQAIANYRVHLHNVSRSKEYLAKANSEFAVVNYNASKLYKGLAKYYLKTYWFDLNNAPAFLVSKLRKFFKVIYILRG